MNKIVFAYDPDTRALLSAVVLDESDMSPLEDGVWLIPGNCTEVAPPVIPEGQFASFVDSAWVLADIPVVTPEEPVEPVIKVPLQITMRQARLALLSFGLLDEVDAAIAALPSPQREAAQIEWDFAAWVERASPVVALLSSSMGLDSATLDSLFTAGSTL